jgi:hypothetical protein
VRIRCLAPARGRLYPSLAIYSALLFFEVRPLAFEPNLRIKSPLPFVSPMSAGL